MAESHTRISSSDTASSRSSRRAAWPRCSAPRAQGLEGFKKQVAIKRVLPHLSEKKKFIAMFLDEARLSAHLSHSNCVQVFDIGVGDNAYFIVMEYVDGAEPQGGHRVR